MKADDHVKQSSDTPEAGRLILAACAAGFFWILAIHILTGVLDFMVKDGVGSRAGMVANIDGVINSVLVVPLGAPLAAGVLFVTGIGAAWLVGRTPRQNAGNEGRRGEVPRTIAPTQGERSVSGKVWMSSVLSPAGLGQKQGTHTKFFNHEWNPASFDIPTEPDEVHAAYRRHRAGYALQRSDFPEAEAVFDEKRFARRRDLFFAGPFFAVKGKLAEVLSRFDLGEGGLIPFPIYRADLVTPIEGDFFLLNFGARKNSFLPEQCGDARKFIVEKNTARQIWDVNYLNPDGEVALSPVALSSPDLWFEEEVHNKIFMSDALAQALIEIGMSDVFKLKPCRIIDSAQ